MKIIDDFNSRETFQTADTLRIMPDGSTEKIKTSILAEHSLDLYLNGKYYCRLTCSPEKLPELVAGRLRTDGKIASAEDIISIEINKDGSSAHVHTVEREETVAACGTGKEKYSGNPLAHNWTDAQIRKLIDVFSQGTDLHVLTKSAHSCILIENEEILYVIEDLGRHNAIDKVIGRALMDGVDLSKTVIYTSGRIPSDMLMKIVNAGIPVMVSKASPTAKAVELAKKRGVTLIASARKDSYSIYNQ